MIQQLVNPENLRREIKHRRKNLGLSSRQEASRQVCLRIAQSREFRRAQTFAAYLAFAGELDIQPIIELGLKLGKRCFLPRITGDSMRFLSYTRGQKLIANSWGINEPHQSTVSAAITDIEFMLCPLVAFDQQGNRLGMGGGFYDRYLQGLRKQRQSRRLWGVGYDFQQVVEIKQMPWDIAMDGIFTPSKTVRVMTRLV